MDYMTSESGTTSDFNNIAFMLIFIFTLQQYRKLQCHMDPESDKEIKRLNVLVTIEVTLI